MGRNPPLTSPASEDELPMSGMGSAHPRLNAVPTPSVRSRHGSLIRMLAIASPTTSTSAEGGRVAMFVFPEEAPVKDNINSQTCNLIFKLTCSTSQKLFTFFNGCCTLVFSFINRRIFQSRCQRYDVLIIINSIWRTSV